MNIIWAGCLFVLTILLCSAKGNKLTSGCAQLFFPCPEDCTKYYICHHGRLLKLTCSAGLHWNDVLQACDWPRNANCVESTKPIVVPTPKPIEEPKQAKKILCYFTNWSSRRTDQGKFLPENIDPNLCTHIIYAFSVLDPETLTIKSSNLVTDIDDRFYERVTAYRKEGAKVMIAVGGLPDSVGHKYDRLLTDANASRLFIASVMDFIQKYHFDGLDIEYPATWEIKTDLKRAQAKQGFAQLVRDLSEAFKPNKWLLSATVSSDPKAIDAGYDVPQLNRYLDWISLMTYEYHDSFDPVTGPIAPISSKDGLNIESTVQYWIKRGASSEKLILGISTAGLSKKLKNPKDHGIGAPSTGPGDAGELTNMPGTLSYYEICNNTINNGWSVSRDIANKRGPFAFKGNQWVSFDDVDNIRAKAHYIRDKNLGGGMIWTLDFDDFLGSCGCGNYPLLTALNLELREIGKTLVQNCT